MTTQKSQKQSTLLLILICIFERNHRRVQNTTRPPLIKHCQSMSAGKCSPKWQHSIESLPHIPKELVEEGIPTGQGTSTFSLAAWNIRIFSNGSRNNAELHHIDSKVLIDYDFIAIVELRDETVLIRTLTNWVGKSRNRLRYLLKNRSGFISRCSVRFPKD